MELLRSILKLKVIEQICFLKEERNEEIAFRDDSFGSGNWRADFCNGGRRRTYRHWISSSATNRFSGSSGSDRGA
jgi:hypothetical protein